MEIFEDYLKSLKTFRISEITESTYRNKLQDLLEAVAEELNPKIKIIHEPKREGRFGSPDYKVTIADNIIGYVENKAISEDLDRVLKSEQIEKYKSLSDNLMLTNYIEFIWLKDGRITKRENLSYLSDFENKKAILNSNKEQAVKDLIKNFFSQAPKGISSSKKLAEALSVRAKLLKDFLFEELKRQEKEHTEGKLYGLYQTFKKYVFNELLIEEFSDTFAQNLVYGLFLAKLNAGIDNVNLYNAKKYITHSFELIKELVGFLDELDNEEYKETRWIVEEVLTVLNNLDIEAITKTLSFNTNISDKDDYKVRDPYIYFYEDFLATYDKKLRKSKGIYYTPIPIVNFIIRSLDDILKEVFEIKDGFADHKKVTVLDFATGTGTFLLEIFNNIFEKLPKESGKKELIIKEHIFKNIYGFEYLIAPYTIAHLKLSQYLKAQGYRYNNTDERFQIFLTNTLEPTERSIYIPLLPELSKETKKAQEIKEEPILVITGNPPYNASSRNNGIWIMELIEDYKFIDGIFFGEKKHWLNDDYVKFIRFAQYKMDKVESGVVGIITNHSFLSNVTFRAMRKSLMNSFNQIYFLDLHGNKKMKEKTPEGETDENVFDIEQGVAISFFVKKKGIENKILHKDLWGTRDYKYKFCLENSIKTINFDEIEPKKSFYFFYKKDQVSEYAYNKFTPITDIFNIRSTGICSQRDAIAVQNDKETLENILKDFEQLNIEELRLKYNIGKDGRDWKVEYAKGNIRNYGVKEEYIKKIHYRPFDKRYTYYTNKSKGFIAYPRYGVFKNLLNGKNIGLICNRTVKIDFNHVFISDSIIDLHILETANASAYLFPLYTSEELIENENFDSNFRIYIDKLYNKHIDSEKVLSYIYAILYSPTYRKKYKEDLAIDFPKIPFIDSDETFKKISNLGFQLIEAHLMRRIPNYDCGYFIGKDTWEVSEIGFERNRININSHQYFDKVSEEIFKYYIGGYQVLDKFLKDRKGKKLTLEEIENIEKVIKVIAFTIDQTKKIDDLTKDWI